MALPIMVLAGLTLLAQDPPPARPRISPTEWAAVRELSQAIATEDGARSYFERNPGLASSFSTADTFIAYLAKWRSRATPLPASLDEALQSVDVSVRDGESGFLIIVTYYHATPANSITMMKTTWRNGRLVLVSFLKGFAHPNPPSGF